MPFFLETDLWEMAWEKVRKTDGANTPGIDGETCNGIMSKVQPWLNSLRSQLLHGNYVPQNIQEIEIPKNSGNGMRTIGILTMKDRVVQTVLKLVLEPIFESQFHYGSFGFRPGRSVATALGIVCKTATSKNSNELTFPYAVHLDVENCFPTLDHAVLLRQFSHLITDVELTKLLQKILNAGAKKTGFLFPRSIGVVQGSALSPMLCNLYLHGLDEEMDSFSRSHYGNIRMFRYADDILLIGKTPQIIENGIHQVKRLLKEQYQKLGNYKPVNTIGECDWLGVQFQMVSNPWNHSVSLGYIIQYDKVRRMFSQIDEMTMPPSEKIAAETFDLGKWLVSINHRLREWYNSVVFAKNASDIFETLDAHLSERVGYLLKNVLKIRMKELYQNYRKRLPRGFSTWEVNGSRLIVLSSLSPKRPVNMIHYPSWEQKEKKPSVSFSQSTVTTFGRKIK